MGYQRMLHIVFFTSRTPPDLKENIGRLAMSGITVKAYVISFNLPLELEADQDVHHIRGSPHLIFKEKISPYPSIYGLGNNDQSTIFVEDQSELEPYISPYETLDSKVRLSSHRGKKRFFSSPTITSEVVELMFEDLTQLHQGGDKFTSVEAVSPVILSLPPPDDHPFRKVYWLTALHGLMTVKEWEKKEVPGWIFQVANPWLGRFISQHMIKPLFNRRDPQLFENYEIGAVHTSIERGKRATSTPFELLDRDITTDLLESAASRRQIGDMMKLVISEWLLISGIPQGEDPEVYSLRKI